MSLVERENKRLTLLKLPSRLVDPKDVIAGEWGDPPEGSPTLSDAVRAVARAVVGIPVKRITKYRRLEERFRYNEELYAAVSAEPQELLVEQRGGYKVVKAIYSDGVGYVVASRGEVLFACSGHATLLCRHMLGAFWHSLPEVMASVTGYSASEWRRRVEASLAQLGDTPAARAAFLYYLLRAMHEGGVKIRVATVPAPAEEEAPSAGFTGPLEEARRRIIRAIESLGVRGLGAGEWPEAIVYALVASADYRDPPVTIHVIGDIGTFKTRGAIEAARMLRIPHLRVRAGGDPREAHRRLLDVLAAHGVLLDPSESGGVLRDIAAQEGYYEAKLSVPHLLALGVDIKRLAEALKQEGFEVETVRLHGRVEILDPSRAQVYEDYRVRYQPSQLGVLKVYDLFDAHVLVVDEGSRNPQALELLLTRLSVSSLRESLRIVVITDNIEPFVEAFSDPRLAPLGDRVIRVMTRGIIPVDKFTVDSVQLDYETLLVARRALDGITVRREHLHLARAAGYALQYVLVVDGDDYILVDRAQERAQGLDLLKGIDAVFKMGGRYMYHVAMLSKFYAFLAGRRTATLEDVLRAVRLAVRSRLVVNASTYLEYKAIVAEVEELVENAIRYVEPLSKHVAALLDAYKAGKWMAAEREAERLVEAGTSVENKLLSFYAALSAVEEGLAERGPPEKGATLKRLAWAVIAAKGDVTDFKSYVPRGYREKVARRE